MADDREQDVAADAADGAPGGAPDGTPGRVPDHVPDHVPGDGAVAGNTRVLPHGTGQAAGARAVRGELRARWVLVAFASVLAFTAVTGVVVFAAASFDGGVPGVTAPAGERRDRPSSPSRLPAPPPDAPSASAATAAPPVPRAAGVAASGVDWTALDHPVDCGGADRKVRDVLVLTTASGPAAIVRVSCDAGSGTPPDTLLAYAYVSGRPRLTATLLSADRERTVRSLSAEGGDVVADVLGWSSPDVPRFAPDVTERLRWRPGNGTWTPVRP